MPRLQRPTTLTAQVVAYIHDGVIRGELKPSQPLAEVALAEELETSRVTVRVALRELADQGLVEIIPYRGAFVSKLTPRMAWEIFSLRALLESYAAKLALERGPLPDEVLAELESALATIADAGVGTDDPMLIIQAIIHFHWLIAAQSEHDLLLSNLKNLEPQLRRLIFYTNLYESDEVSDVESHTEVLDALRVGDPEHAEQVIFDHHYQSGIRLVKRLEAMEQ